jgi:hypothetical protein
MAEAGAAYIIHDTMREFRLVPGKSGYTGAVGRI